MKIKLYSILGIFVLMVLNGCTQYYSSSEDAINVKYSGNIEDLDFCNIQIVKDGYGKFGYSFIGLHKKIECVNLKNSCDFYNDSCEWYIKTATQSNNWGKWYTSHRTTCICNV